VANHGVFDAPHFPHRTGRGAVVAFRALAGFSPDPLTDLLRQGVRQLIAQAVGAGSDGFSAVLAAVSGCGASDPPGNCCHGFTLKGISTGDFSDVLAAVPGAGCAEAVGEHLPPA